MNQWETTVEIIKLDPPITTTMSRDVPELNIKKGEKVELTCLSINGTIARSSTSNRYLPLADYDLSPAHLKTLKGLSDRKRQEVLEKNSFRPSSPARFQRSY